MWYTDGCYWEGEDSASKMKEYIKESAYILNTHLIFVFILSISGITVFSSKVSTTMSVINLLGALIFTPIIFARLVEIVRAEQNRTLFALFKKYSILFYIVSVVLSSPMLMFIFLGSGIFTFCFYPMAFAIALLSLYVMPLIFLDRQSVAVIPEGIKYFVGNLNRSLPLAVLTLSIHVINASYNSIARLHSQDNLLMVLLMGFVKELICNYLHLLVFLSAVMLLLNDPYKAFTFHRKPSDYDFI